MVHRKGKREIEFMRESNRIVARVLKVISDYIEPGVSTKELDLIAEKIIAEESGRPAFKGYTVPGLSPFPGTLCTSVNSCIVHGIPKEDVILKEGDIVGIDVGVEKNGYFGDGAVTFAVGKISETLENLLNVTKESLNLGIQMAKAGKRLGDVSYAIGSFVKNNRLFVADNLTGHGIGKQLQEEPLVPNNGIPNRGLRLKPGMTIAIEPMVNIGTNRVIENGWEYYVADGSMSAHFEHTILITDCEPEILTCLSE